MGGGGMGVEEEGENLVVSVAPSRFHRAPLDSQPARTLRLMTKTFTLRHPGLTSVGNGSELVVTYKTTLLLIHSAGKYKVCHKKKLVLGVAVPSTV